MKTSEQIAALASALLAVQKELPTVKKGKVNPFFKNKYADLASVLQALLPIITKNGLVLTQQVSNIDGMSALTTTLIHESGEYISSTRPLLLSKEDPQGQGSAITYARRYDAMAIIGMIADEDDDGNRATTSYVPNGTTQHNKVKPEARMAEYGKDQDAVTARGLMVQEFFDKGITNYKDQSAFIKQLIGKEAPTDIKEVEQVITALKEA